VNFHARCLLPIYERCGAAMQWPVSAGRQIGHQVRSRETFVPAQ
jgi:hypothetical protein